MALPVLSEEDDRIWLGCGEHARLGLWSPGEKEFGDRGGRHVHFAFSVDYGALLSLRDRLSEIGVEHRGPVRHEAATTPSTSRTRRATSSRRGSSSKDGEGADASIDALA